MNNYLSDLAIKLQSVADVIPDGRRVKNEFPHDVKSTLLTASYALNDCATRIVFPPEGLPKIVNARGESRNLTWRERLAIRILGGCRTNIRV